MNVIRTQAELRTRIAEARQQGSRIGFVPTMGGLHAGHLSLVARCQAECDLTVVSVFLNPTQFNDKRDLLTYPHDPAVDEFLLREAGVHVMFAPTADEMYSEGEATPHFAVGRVAEVMEGAHRPGHFDGVMWVVSKLFRLVTPDVAYFGEKDFQQIAVIRKMISLAPDMAGIQIVPCPVVREADGLAMSSRNARLTPEQRAAAPEIYRALQHGVALYREGKSVSDIHRSVVAEIEQHPLLRVEYLSIVDGSTLEEVNDWSASDDVVGCITVFCGEVRLIDHIHFA